MADAGGYDLHGLLRAELMAEGRRPASGRRVIIFSPSTTADRTFPQSNPSTESKYGCNSSQLSFSNSRQTWFDERQKKEVDSTLR
jgi:hypothetical protein